MGQQCSGIISRSSCGPGVPGEFDFVPGYTKLPDDSVDPSSPSRPLARSRAGHSCTGGGEEALLARRKPRAKSNADRELIGHALRSRQLFKQVDGSQIKSLVDAMEYYEFNAGDVVLKEGSFGSYYYVAHSAGLDLVLHGETVRSLLAGQTFGELALLQKCKEFASIVASRNKVGVWAAPSELFRQAVMTAVIKQVQSVRAFLDNVPVLQGLSARELDCIADMSHMESYRAGPLPSRSKAAEQSYAYFVKSGELRREEKIFGIGSCLGERALLYGDASGVTAEVTKQCELLLVNARKLRQVLGKQALIKLHHQQLRSILKGSSIFSALTPSQIASLVQSLELREYLPGAKIPAAIGFFVVLDGNVQVGQRPAARVLQPGQLEAPPAASSGAALDLLSLTSAHEDKLFAGHFGCRLAVLPDNESQSRSDSVSSIKVRMLQMMSWVSIFQSLKEVDLDAIVRRTVSHLCHQDEYIVKQGETGLRFYVLAAGEVEVIKDGHSVRRLTQTACFGERALLYGESWPVSVRVVSSTAEVWAWERSNLLEVLEKEAQAAQWLRYRAALLDPNIRLNDLRKLGLLGCGSSGSVTLVRHQHSGVKYALKKMDKVDGKVPPEVDSEIQVLTESDHPFLMHMVKAMATPKSVYVLAEYIQGGELHAAMRTISTVFSRSQAKFYIGALLLMLEAMQERNVVHRDLKPENIMLDAEGYPKLIDFGTSKRLGAKCGRTFTLVGTVHYMAPETMRGKGYGVEVDVWALGVVLYELVCGHLPFGEKAQTDSEVCKAVIAGKPELPQDLDDCSKVLIEGLLEPRPRRRLGCGANGLEDVKDSQFFRTEGLSKLNGGGNGAQGGANSKFFEMLMGRKLKAPIKPQVRAPEGDADGEPLSDIEMMTEDCNGTHMETGAQMNGNESKPD